MVALLKATHIQAMVDKEGVFVGFIRTTNPLSYEDADEELEGVARKYYVKGYKRFGVWWANGNKTRSNLENGKDSNNK